jgi:putative membrane protein
MSLALHAAGEQGPGTAWGVDPWVLLGICAAALLYAAGWRRLRRRGRPDLASVPRAACFGAGLAVIGLALVSPLDHIGEEYLLSAHMTQHMLIGDAGPLLLVLGLAGPLALFVVPRPALRAAARPRPRRALRVLALPAVAFVAWCAVTCGWHLPGPYGYALDHRWAHDLEHLSMLAVGLAVWAHIVGLFPRVRMSHARRAGYALGLFMVGMVVSEVLFLRDPLYAVYANQPERLLGLSPAADQMRAALIMASEQMLTLLTAAGLLLWTHVERAAGPAPSPAPRTGYGRRGLSPAAGRGRAPAGATPASPRRARGPGPRRSSGWRR